MKTYLSQLGLFSEKEIDDLLIKAVHKKIPKGGLLLREGSVCREIAFIISGFFRSYYYNSSDEQVTYCFSSEQSFIADYASFITGEPAKEGIEAMYDSEVIVFSKKDILALEKDYKWLLFFKNLADKEFIRLENRFFSQMKETAENRYKKLISEHPEYLALIPLNDLASYLGISQRHLTRIRKHLH